MDHDQIRRQLLDLVGRIGSVEPDAHVLDDGISLYQRERMIPGRLKPRSIEANTVGLRRLSEWRGTACIATTPWANEAWEWYALEGSKIWRALQLLRAILIMAQREGWRHEPHGLGDVMRKAEYRPREEVYDERQIVDFFAACERLDRADEQRASGSASFAGSIHGVRQRAREVLRLLALTGCRLSEICQLTFEEIHPTYLRLRDSKTGPRTVPLGYQAQLVLGRQRVRSSVVFPGRWPHKPIGARTVQEMFEEVKREAGLRDGSVHTLRHTAATLLIRNGVPLQVVQKILGHATASYVTQRYIHLASRDTALGVAVLENAIANARGGSSDDA